MGPTKLHFPLNVHHFALTGPDSRRDPGRPAERKSSELEHRQPIDLSDLGAVGVDVDRISQDLFPHPLLHAVGAESIRIDGTLHIPGRHDGAAILPCPVIRFAKQVRQIAHR
jgi:hypothetical protein